MDKSRAFRAARRHSVRVRILRWVMFAGALTVIAGIAVFVVFDPFHRLKNHVSVEDTSIDGTKVTMSHPKLAGYHSDGRPYQIMASSAVQDIKTPNLFELRDMDARLTMADKTVTHVTAQSGSYDSTRETMDLTSEVQISSDSGLEMRARNAHVEFKSGALVTQNPVTVAMRGNTIAADSMRMSEGGKQVTFEGHVRTTIVPAEKTEAASADAQDSRP